MGEDVQVSVDNTEEIEEVVGRDLSAIDSLLDQIDATLEKNASAFVNSFVQKGGQ